MELFQPLIDELMKLAPALAGLILVVGFIVVTLSTSNRGRQALGMNFISRAIVGLLFCLLAVVFYQVLVANCAGPNC